MRDGVSCKKCVRYAACAAEAGSELDTEASDCELYDPMTKHLSVPCAECEHFQPFNSGRVVYARCPWTGTAFLRFTGEKDSKVLDPKVHTCREATPKSQTFAKER